MNRLYRNGAIRSFRLSQFPRAKQRCAQPASKTCSLLQLAYVTIRAEPLTGSASTLVSLSLSTENHAYSVLCVHLRNAYTLLPSSSGLYRKRSSGGGSGGDCDGDGDNKNYSALQTVSVYRLNCETSPLRAA